MGLTTGLCRMYTLGDIPRNGALNFADRTAVIFEDVRYTYEELNRRVNRCAQALAGLGCRRGGSVAILADNCAKYLEAYFAAAKLGVTVTPLNVRLGDDETVFIVNDSEATVLFVGDGYEPRCRSLRGRLGGVGTVIGFDLAFDGALDYEALLANASDDEPDADRYAVDPDDTAILMYTGGTTGVPKGVMLSHRNAIMAPVSIALQGGYNSSDSTCFVLPVFHVSWWPVLMLLLLGGKVCINRWPDLDRIFQLIERERCTHINLVPTIYGWIVDDPRVDNYDLSSLRSLTYGGSPFPVEVLKKCIRKFGNRFAQGYGATETAAMPITMLSDVDHVVEGEKSRVLSSAGKPALFSRVKVVDEHDNTLSAGRIGEICTRGEHVMKGYWKNPELTAQALRGGWYHTGDMGYVDAEGYVFLTDRKADMIITGGENVYPREVEDVIYAHPAVRECAVVATPHEAWGEIVHAVVVLGAGASATAQDIIDHCRKTLAGYKCPKAVTFWEALPKTVIGKVTKKEIKQRFHDEMRLAG